jgi:hypothetical protein
MSPATRGVPRLLGVHSQLRALVIALRYGIVDVHEDRLGREARWPIGRLGTRWCGGTGSTRARTWTAPTYHDDAVLEFPQSGERFEGVASFTEWRRQYPAEVSYRLRRVTAREDLVVVELSVSYGGSPWMFGVQLLEFDGDKVARERIYVMEGWEAPEWRAPWRADAPADPPD